MKIFYISPSAAPSRAANLVHVICMCEAFIKLNYEVVLFLTHIGNKSNSIDCYLQKNFSLSKSDIQIVLNKQKFKRGRELGIALNAILFFFKEALNGSSPSYIISRNLYGALFFGFIMRKNVVYETHTLEKGFRRHIQNLLINSNKIRTVVISNALKKIIAGNNQILENSIHVFHDSARAGRTKLNSSLRYKLKRSMMDSMSSNTSYDKAIGYFGHLYHGRGIEIIQALAERHSNYAFFVFGGNKKEIELFKINNKFENLFFMGFIDQKSIYEKMSVMDVLLMPYQKQVSIGIDSIDTSKWMSPMKMFEYMSASVPIISSNLPVLREVLIDNKNSILVEPDDVNEWSNALENLFNKPDLAIRLSENSYKDYQNKYTWNIRAQGILQLFPND